MLSWFRKKLESLKKPGPARWPDRSGARVTFDDDTITLRDAQGNMSELAWSDLASITILTTAAGPMDNDLFWILAGGERGRTLSIPMGAEGEHELLHAMQARLPDFDNVTVIEAMGSTSDAAFTVWERGPPVRKPVV